MRMSWVPVTVVLVALLGWCSAQNSTVPQCSQPMVVGPCRSALKRFFFNTTSGQCQQFLYGGCRANGNNFNNMTMCTAACGGLPVPVAGTPTMAPTTTTTSVPQCSQPMMIGPCRASNTRYFYNSTSGQCQQFLYGGCRGNNNNFNNMTMCTTACGNAGSPTMAPTTTTTSVPPCSQPMMIGPCRASNTRYFYNTTSGQCQQFLYGGCRANGNNFNTMPLCTAACVVPQCSQPAVTGMCRGYMPSFYHNSTTKTCQSFVYGGCGGNTNRFSTVGECNTVCGVVPQCSQPAVTGMCRGYMPSFYYNSKTKTCQSFVYGGCGGNTNRFATAGECMSACGGTLRLTTPKPVVQPGHLECYVCNSITDPSCTRYGMSMHKNAKIISGCRACVTKTTSLLGISVTLRTCGMQKCTDNAETTCCYQNRCNSPSFQGPWTSNAPAVMSMTTLIVTMAALVLALLR